MKKRMKILAVILGVICSYVVAFQTGKAMGIEPGSNMDPLVSKSYVDKKIDEIVELLNQLETQTDTNSGSNGISNPTSNSNSSNTTNQPKTEQEEEDNLTVEEIFQLIDLKIGSLSKELEMKQQEEVQIPVYTPIQVEAGYKIVGEQGTEMILRSGIAKAIASPQGGLQDMTDGVDLQDLQSVPKYHLIIIPRTDGRGFAVEQSAWIMVRGKYEIQPVSAEQ